MTDSKTYEQNLAALAKADEHNAGLRPEGYQKIQKFCDAVDAGEVPDTDLLTDFSTALKEITNEQDRVKGLAAFGKEIGLNKKRGVKKSSLQETYINLQKKIVAVYIYNKLMETNSEKFAALTVAEQCGISMSLVREWAVTEYVKILVNNMKPTLDDIAKNLPAKK